MQTEKAIPGCPALQSFRAIAGHGMSEKISNLKLAPLTENELEFIQWQIWEPLRRNQHYTNEFAKLKSSRFLDPNLEDTFCKKWVLPYHVDPDTEFKNLTNPKWLFWNLYKPIFDNAACVDPWHWIVEEKYLRVWIDLESSRNQIEDALKRLAILIDNAGPYEPPKKVSIEDIILPANQFYQLDVSEKQALLFPWLKEDSINLISGWRGCGKTWFALGVLDAVTRGESFGPWKCEKPVPCLFLDGEMTITDDHDCYQPQCNNTYQTDKLNYS